MVVSIARQSVIIKCLRQKSVLLGNYEFYYLSGLLNHLYHIGASGSMQPEELLHYIHGKMDDIHPADEKEEYLLKLVSFYLPGEEYDEQMKTLFRWGEQEPELWSINTSHLESEFI